MSRPQKDLAKVPIDITIPRSFNGPIAPPHILPKDDFELREELKLLAEHILKNLNEIVLIPGYGKREPFEITRREVFQFAANMASDTVLAGMMTIDQPTLIHHFKREIDFARNLSRYRLQNQLWNIAVSGNNIPVLLFCAKNYLGMTDIGLTKELDAGRDNKENEHLVTLTPGQVTALLKNAKLTNTISIEHDNEQ